MQDMDGVVMARRMRSMQSGVAVILLSELPASQLGPGHGHPGVFACIPRRGDVGTLVECIVEAGRRPGHAVQPDHPADDLRSRGAIDPLRPE